MQWEKQAFLVERGCPGIRGESSAVVVILWLNGLQTELMFVIVLLSNLYIWKQWKMGEFFYTSNLSFDKLLK